MDSNPDVDIRQAAEQPADTRRIELYPRWYAEAVLMKWAEEAGLPLAFMGAGAYEAFSRMVATMYEKGSFLGQAHDTEDRKTLATAFEKDKGYRITLSR